MSTRSIGLAFGVDAGVDLIAVQHRHGLGRESCSVKTRSRIQSSNGQTLVAITEIQSSVAQFFGVSVADLKGTSTTRAISVPRQVAIYLARRLTGASLEQIGEQFGGRLHTTVEHAISRVDSLRRSDPTLNGVLEKLGETLKRAAES